MFAKHHLLTVLLFVVSLTATFLCRSAQAQIDLQNPPPHDPPYPIEWWSEIPRENAPAWEIFPQDAKYGEVILSKRTELGIFSNFAATPFTYKGKTYASVEGFWQATKYPESPQDPRAHFFKEVPYTRAQVEQLIGFEAKKAGDLASEIMQKQEINWVSFEGEQMIYKAPGDSPFYLLIREVMWQKLKQNPKVEELLKKTDTLILKPDHSQGVGARKAWFYNEIWMDFRTQLLTSVSHRD